MAASVDMVLDRIEKMGDRLHKVEETFAALGESQRGVDDAIRKALTGAKGKAFTPRPGTTFGAGRDWKESEKELVDICDVIDPKRAKCLGPGFSEFLTCVAQTADPARFNVQNMGVVQKALEHMRAQPIQKTALAEGSGATGGYTVPPQFVGELLRLAAEKSFLRPLCRNLPMTSRTIQVPVLDQTKAPPTNGSSFYGGIAWTWQPEANNYQTNASTNPSFRQVELVARDLVGIVISSNQLLADNAIALDTILTTLFRDSMAWAYDYFILRGLGASQPLGMLTSGAALHVTKASAGHFGAADIAAMQASLPQSCWDSAVWICHQSVLPELLTMTNGATNSPNLVWLNPMRATGDSGPLASNIPMTILGRPVFFTEKLPKLASGSIGSVMLVDPSKYLIGDRMAIQVEASPYPNFSANQMTWRIIARWDGQPEQSGPSYLADGSYQVSPIVVLDA